MKKELVYQKQFKLSVTEFFSKLPNFIAMLVSAFVSSSLLVWLDVIDSAINVVSIGFVTVISKKFTKNLKYQYNYGIERVEALAALFIESFEIFSLLIIIFLSVTQLMNPSRPSELLLLPVLFKLLKLAGDFVIFIRQKNIKNNANTKIVHFKYTASVKDIMFDSVTFVSVFICWVFREYRIAWYFSPVMCVIISVFVIYHSLLGIRTAVSELSEKTLPEEEQMKILRCLSEFYSEYTDLISVNSLVRDNTNYIELHLKFAPEMTFEQIDGFKQRFSDRLREEMPDCEVRFVI